MHYLKELDRASFFESFKNMAPALLVKKPNPTLHLALGILIVHRPPLALEQEMEYNSWNEMLNIPVTIYLINHDKIIFSPTVRKCRQAVGFISYSKN